MYDFRNVLEEIGIIFQRCTTNHSYVAQCITNSCDQLPESVQVCHTLSSRSESLDITIHGFCSLVWVHVAEFVFLFSPIPVLLHEWLSDEVVIKELVEYVQFLDQELVECVNDCAHYTDSMSFDRVVHLIYSDSLDLFCL